MRRFTAATLTAAEVAAMLAGVLETPLAPGEQPINSEKMWDTIELVRGTRAAQIVTTLGVNAHDHPRPVIQSHRE